MPAHQFHRPTGRSVWIGKDLHHTTDWLYQFSPKAIAEIDDTLARLKGVDVLSITRKDVPFTAMAADLRRLKEEIGTGRGFVIMRGLSPEKYSTDDLAKVFWGIGTHFGVAEVQSFLGDRLGDIIDLSDEEPDPRKRRGYHSGGEQETHTDSGDMVAMLSICMAKSGGASRLISAHAVHNLMLDYCPGLLQQYYDGFFIRRADSDAAAAGQPALSAHRVPAYSYKDGWLNCSFVRGYVERAIAAGDIKVNPVELAAMDAYEAFSNHPDLRFEHMLYPGDMQFFNNRTVLHGRAGYEDYPERERRRHLLRLWLSVPDWPRLPDSQHTHSDEDKVNWGKNAKERVPVHA